MMDDWRRRRAAKRVKPGDGNPLPPFRWWQLFSRSVFTLTLQTTAVGTDTYAVDVRLWGDRDDGEVRARLYRDGRQVAVSKVPARLPVPGGVIEVQVGGFGMRRCHFVADDGTERQLTPDPRTAEGRRARLDRDHPDASRVIAVVSTILVLVGVALTLLQLAEPISQIPPIADTVGTVTSPLHLPLWANITLVVATALGSTERALRLRATWLDSLAN